MKSLSFFVPGIPKGQPRPKAFARRFGDRWMARVYDPGTAENWKSQIAMAAKESLENANASFTLVQPYFTGPVLFSMECFLPRPKSHFKSNGELKGSAPTYAEPKPDFDNYAKAVADALTQLGIWRDDSQVCAHSFVKRYVSSDTYGAGALITIRELGVEQVEAERVLEL